MFTHIAVDYYSYLADQGKLHAFMGNRTRAIFGYKPEVRWANSTHTKYIPLEQIISPDIHTLLEFLE